MSGRTVLFSSWVEKEEEAGTPGVRVIKIDAGEPHERARYGAAVDRYNAVTGRERPTEETLRDLVGQKVTTITFGENMIGGGLLVAQEGKLFPSTRGGYGILPKGSRKNGLHIHLDMLLDVLPGYSTAQAAELVERVKGTLPILTRLTQERLMALPHNSNTMSLCVFGEYALPDGRQRDAIYLARNYLREDDIVEGVLLCRPELGFSESGSVWGRQLLNSAMGEVVAFKPITFQEAIDLCDAPFEEAYERVLQLQIDGIADAAGVYI